jgi:hypothetical protein
MNKVVSQIARLTVTVSLLLMTASRLDAAETTIGTSGAQFLKIGVGSRYLAMGEASVANVGDVYSMYWNPAGLSQIERTSAAFTSVSWIADLNMNYFGLATRVGDQGVLGASFSALTAPELEITTFEDQDGTGNFYTASSFAIGLSYARQLTARVSLGGSIKYIEERIHLDRASGVGLDFGTLIYTGYESLRLGMSISNMGSRMSFSGPSLDINYDPEQGQGANGTIPASVKTTGYSLPLTFRFGMAYDLSFGERAVMTITADLKHPNDNIQQGGIGAEMAFSERYFLRGGYKINYEEENFGFGGGLQTGLGKQTKLQLDYSWSDFGRLESAQRISVGLTF